MASSITITTSLLASKFAAELLKDGELESLRSACEAAQAEQVLTEQASVSLRQDQLSAARRALAMDPSAENLNRLRELNGMTDQDFYALQQGHARRRDTVVREQVAPLAAGIFGRLSKAIASVADGLEGAETAAFAAFDLPHEPSALLSGLRSQQTVN